MSNWETDWNYTQILAAIRSLESGGNYSAHNPGSSASGAYQFTTDTWLRFGGGQYAATASQASPAQQDAVAMANVKYILGKYGTLEAVPAAWYSGSYDPGHMDYVPGSGNKLTVRGYVDEWMQKYNSQQFGSSFAGWTGGDVLNTTTGQGDSLGSRLAAIAGVVSGGGAPVSPSTVSALTPLQDWQVEQIQKASG